jgi:hypothetical protein
MTFGHVLQVFEMASRQVLRQLKGHKGCVPFILLLQFCHTPQVNLHNDV